MGANAAAQARLKVGAQRTLEAVACSRLLASLAVDAMLRASVLRLPFR